MEGNKKVPVKPYSLIGTFLSFNGLRQVAGNYAYDNLGIEQADTITLRSGGDTINSELVEKLNERLEMAGISVLEARINYLAYAPEIAAVMLRRQQAEAWSATCSWSSAPTSPPSLYSTPARSTSKTIETRWQKSSQRPKVSCFA